MAARSKLLCLPALFLWGVITARAQNDNFPPEPPVPTASAAWDAALSRSFQARQQGRAADGIADLERSAKLIDKQTTDEAWFQYEMAQNLEVVNRVDDAIEAWKKCIAAFHALQAGPSGVDSNPEEMMAEAYLGVLLLNNKRPGGEDRLRHALEMARSEKVRPRAMRGSLQVALVNLHSDIVTWDKPYFEAMRDLSGTFAPASQEHGDDLDQLAWFYLQTAELDHAIETFQQAETIFGDIQHGLLEIEQEQEQASKTSPQGGLRAQDAQTQKDERLRRISYFAQRKARDMVGRGLALHQKGDPAAARRLLDATVKFLEENARGSDAHVQALLARSRVETDTQGFIDAGKDLMQVASMLRADDTMWSQQLLNGLGRLALTRGDRLLAEEYFRIAETDLVREAPMLQVTSENQAELADAMFQNRRDAKSAESRLQSAEDSDAVFGRKLDLARDKLIRIENDPEVSDAARAQLLAEVRKLLEPTAPRSELMAWLEFQEGMMAGSQKKYSESSQHFDNALDIFRTFAPHSLNAAAALHNVAEVTKDPAKAEELGRQAFDIVLDQAAEFPGEGGLELNASTLTNYGVALALNQVEQGKNAQALTTLEQSRSNGLLHLIEERGKLEGNLWRGHQVLLTLRHTREKAYDEAMAAVGAAWRNLDTLEAKRAPQDDIAHAQDLASSKRAAFETARNQYVAALQATDSIWTPQQAEASKPEKDVPAAALQRKLDAGTVFVMFGMGNRKLVTAVARGGSPEVLIATVDLREKLVQAPCGDGEKTGSGLTLSAAAICYRAVLERTLVARGLGQAATPLSQAIFNLVFPGKLRSTVLSAKRLVISPDGFLWTLPFAALVSNTSGPAEYLGLQVPISYTTSLLAWTHDHDQPARSGSGGKLTALVVGDPEQEIAPELSEARHESELVSCLYDTKPLEREAASEDQVRKAIESADIVHFATHGVLDPDLPMFSALQLAQSSAPADDTDHDGRLEAWEVFSQFRLKAELVVLSACETAVGKTVRGEGIIGLPRSFEYAGARSVLASLWWVQDPATEALMRGFYSGLSQGLSKDAALQKAMQSVHGRKGWESPVYWAAFVLMGNPANGGLQTALKPECGPQ